MAGKHLAAALISIALAALFFIPYISFALQFPLPVSVLSAAAFAAYMAAFYMAARKKDFSEGTLAFSAFLHLTLFSLLMTFTFFNALFTFLAVITIAIAFAIARVFSLRDLLKTTAMFFVVFIAATTLFQPAVSISSTAGAVLSGNWWEALNWIKNNTQECAVVATYWDPGHFITGIAKRPVVFDGASQNAVWSTTGPAGLSQEEIREIAATEKFQARNTTANGEQKTVIETARIQDIATTLFTDNETFAAEILEKYKKPGCSEMYYLATSDLIAKSFWWTYFSTWNPVDKGCATPMSHFQLAGSPRPSASGGTTYTYAGGLPAGCNNQVPGSIIVVDQGGELSAFVSVNNQLLRPEQFFYFTQTQGLLRTAADPQIDGLIWLSPERQTAIFVPPEIKDSMFTRMFFFNGQGLERFEFVNSWGGEVKLFRIRFSGT